MQIEFSIHLHLKEIPPLDILERSEKELKKTIETDPTGAFSCAAPEL
jgi:hypothetical protein